MAKKKAITDRECREILGELRTVLDKAETEPLTEEELRKLFGKEYELVEALVALLRSQKRTNAEIMELFSRIVCRQVGVHPG